MRFAHAPSRLSQYGQYEERLLRAGCITLALRCRCHASAAACALVALPCVAPAVANRVAYCVIIRSLSMRTESFGSNPLASNVASLHHVSAAASHHGAAQAAALVARTFSAQNSIGRHPGMRVQVGLLDAGVVHALLPGTQLMVIFDAELERDPSRNFINI